MRVFEVGAGRSAEPSAEPFAGLTTEPFAELPALPEALPQAGFLWLAVARDELAALRADLQSALARWTGAPVVDLHVSDLLNSQLPSHFESTSRYDLLVFRGLTADAAAAPGTAAGALALGSIDTLPTGFVVFDRVLLSVHAAGCTLPEHFAQRLGGSNGGADLRGRARLPSSPAELMLRMVSHLVDGFLELRRALTRHLGRQQQNLLDPKSRSANWQQLLDSRAELHLLEDICEDQRAALGEWIESLEDWPEAADPAHQREHELLLVRSRDAHEHVERVLGHVGRLERSAEAAVQMHFSAIAHRTNNIMRTLTVLTAVFLPLNLITGFFGMNFDTMPLIHRATGVWIAVGVMVAIVLASMVWFWRKRYLDSAARR